MTNHFSLQYDYESLKSNYISSKNVRSITLIDCTTFMKNSYHFFGIQKCLIINSSLFQPNYTNYIYQALQNFNILLFIRFESTLCQSALNNFTQRNSIFIFFIQILIVEFDRDQRFLLKLPHQRFTGKILSDMLIIQLLISKCVFVY